MEDYTNNSHVYKDKQKEAEKKPEKKVEKVVTGKAKTKKKGPVQSFVENFLGSDLHSIQEHIMGDLIIPAVKKAIDDTVSETIHMLLYNGESSRRNQNNATRIAYGGFYGKPVQTTGSRTRSALDYDDILFDTRGDAEAVLTQMEEIIARYQFCSVADYFDLAGLNAPYTSSKYGWTSVRNADIIRAREGGYVIKLPRAMPLD